MRGLRVPALAVALCALAIAAAAGGKARGGGGVEIKVGQERKAESLRIAFVRVAEDSRCPEGVQCVWAGNARARFSATDRKGACVEFDLNTGVEPFEYRFGEHTIRLAKLAPNRVAGRELRSGDYVATVVVTKAKK